MPSHKAVPMTEIDIADDEALRFIQRVLESDAPREDRDRAAQMVRDIRTRVRKAYAAAGVLASPEMQSPPEGGEGLASQKATSEGCPSKQCHCATALQWIADMDPAGKRADDLGRAARMARDALSAAGVKARPGYLSPEACAEFAEHITELRNPDGVMACDTVELTRLADAFERSADWLDKGVLTGSRRTHPLVGTADYRKAAEALRAARGVGVRPNAACGVHGPIPCEGAGCICTAGVKGREFPYMDPQAVRERAAQIEAIVVQAMDDAWDDFVMDTNCFPDDFTLQGKSLGFKAGRWATFIGQLVARRLAAAHGVKGKS